MSTRSRKAPEQRAKATRPEVPQCALKLAIARAKAEAEVDPDQVANQTQVSAWLMSGPEAAIRLSGAQAVAHAVLTLAASRTSQEAPLFPSEMLPPPF